MEIAQPQQRAVIDLGTNTFHLLIAEVNDGRIEERYRERIYVKLASEGIETIGAEPFERGLAALRHFKKVLDTYGVEEVTAIGTAALRTASNGPNFVRRAGLETGIAVRLIPGDTEAEYITRGVLAALPPLDDTILIMDIGGGSTEYILASAVGVYWRQSFPLGVAVLQRAFHQSDPITASEIATLDAFLDEELRPLAEALKQYPSTHLVGAAGTFDAMATVLGTDAPAAGHAHRLSLYGLGELHNTLIASSLSERLAMEALPDERADLIVVAMLLIRYTMRLAGTEKITVSDYAMKEGILLSTNGSGRNPGSR